MLFCEQERAPLTDGSDTKTRSKPFLTITAFKSVTVQKQT